MFPGLGGRGQTNLYLPQTPDRTPTADKTKNKNYTRQVWLGAPMSSRGLLMGGVLVTSEQLYYQEAHPCMGDSALKLYAWDTAQLAGAPLKRVSSFQQLFLALNPLI